MIFPLEVIQTIAALCLVSAGDNPSMNNQAFVNEGRQIRCQAFFVSCLERQPKTVKDAQRGFAACILERKLELDPPTEAERKSP